MHAEKTSDRKWVKKAGAAFLLVMALLTLFSRTIMNLSLPSVSTRQLESGNLKYTVTGSGEARASGSYELRLGQTRTISEVCVSTGDQVEAGDVLFRLEEGDSRELTEALDQLDDLKLQYQKMLLSHTGDDLGSQNTAVARARADLEAAIEERDACQVSQSQLDAAKREYEALSESVQELTRRSGQVQEELSEYAGASDEALLNLERQIEDKERQLENAETDKTPNPVSLESLQRELRRLEEDYELALARHPDIEQTRASLENAKAELDEAKAQLAADPDNTQLQEKVDKLTQEVGELTLKVGEASELVSLERQIEDKKREIENYEPYLGGSGVDTEQLRIELERLRDDYRRLLEENELYARTKAELDEINDRLSDETEAMEKARENYDELQSRMSERERLDEEVAMLQRQLEDALYSLSTAQEGADASAAMLSLDLQDLQKDIDRQSEEVEKIRKAAEGNEVKAEKAGTVQTIGIYEGGEAAPDTVLAVIDTPEEGYKLELLVERELAERFEPGGGARTNDYTVTAELRDISPSPGGDAESMVMTFLLGGEVEPGRQYTVTMENEGKLYDLLVPQSAMHVDSSGSFVLVLETKQTPFGERYYAKRMSVKILEQNSQYAAIEGNFGTLGSVITYASQPIESGDQVRVGEDAS